MPLELLEIAAKVEFTPEELRMLLAELEAAKAAERDKAFAWPVAEYVPLVFTTTDEKAARAWRRGGGLPTALPVVERRIQRPLRL